MLKMENGNLMVKGGNTDVYTVKVDSLSSDLMLTVYLKPNRYSYYNGVKDEMFTVDILNESVADVLSAEGYVVVTEADIKMIQL